MTKKLVAAFLSAVTLTAALAGCGDAKPSSSQTASSSQASSAAESSSQEEAYQHSYPLVDEKVSFTGAIWTPDYGKKEWLTKMEELTGVHFDWLDWSDWDTQYALSLASDNRPDLYFLGGKDKADAYDNGKAGIFVNYADYLKYMPNYCAIGEKDPQLWAACKNEDGSIYSLSQYSATSTRESAVIYARTDMLDEAGYSVPTTTDEFMQAIQGLQKFYGEKDSNFVAFQPYNAGHMDNAENAFFPAFGDAVDPGFGLDSEGKVTYNYISDQYKHYLEFMSEVYGSGAFDTNIYTEDGTNAKAKIQSNQTAFTTFGTCLTMDQFKSGHYDVIALEPLTSQYTDTKKFPYRPLTNFIGMMISSDCKDVETLVKWVDTLYTPEDKAINGFWGISMWLGIQGEQWDYTSDDKTTYTIYPPEGMTSSQFLHDIWGTGNVIYCDVFKAVTVGAGNEGLGCKGTYTVQNLWPYSVDVFPEMLLTFTEEEQDIVANKLSAIKTYVAAEKAKFIAGARSLDTWDSFVSDVKSMGIDDVIAAYNAAYARYLQLIND